MSNIEIFIRHCFYSKGSSDKVNKRLENFSLEICNKNLLRTIEPYKDVVNVTYLLDTKYRKDKKHFIENGTNKIIEHQSGNDGKSFTAMLNYVESLNLKDETIVYFLEDDYLHADDWVAVMIDAYKTIPKADYITLYDHNDKYGLFPIYDNLKSKIYTSSYCHWREIPNTTSTYSMKFSTLKNHINIHKFYTTDEYIATRNSSNMPYDAEKFRELVSKGYILISPMPGFSTHVENPFMSPFVDWNYYINREINE